MKETFSKSISVIFISITATSLIFGVWELLALSGQLLKIFPAPSQIYDFATSEIKNFFSGNEGSLGIGIHLYHLSLIHI